MKAKPFYVRAILVCLFCFLSLIGAACGNQADEAVTDGISVSISIIDQEGKELLSKSIEVEKGSSAGDAVKKACQSEKFAFQETNGMYDGFGGVASTETDGWLFYVNDTLADVGANDYTVEEGDSISFQYKNYDEAFAS